MAVPLNWKHLGLQFRRSFIGTRGTHRRLTGHRIRILLAFWAIFIPHQIVSRICLALDDVFFPGWRSIRVEKPVFIVGPFRSGTTFLHRMLALEDSLFTTFRTWEIYLAPSVLQRRILKAWKNLDSRMGSPMMNRLRRYNSTNLKDIRFHKVGLWKEEEDEGLFLFAWESLFTWFFFPDRKGMDDYVYADHEMSPRRRRRKWRFYRDCVRRHMYSHPEASVYLSKNPAFTPKLAGLKEAFPDARIIYMIRDPERVLVSQAAWFSFVWHYFASPLEDYPFCEDLFEMTRHWYSYPLDFLSSLPENEFLVTGYDGLISHPADTIRKLCRHFGLEISEEFEVGLPEKRKTIDEYASAGSLSPESVGYDRARIAEAFSDINRRFGFVARE